MNAPMHREENMFGKIRGRFDEKFAQQIMLTQAERALAAVMSMDNREFAVFRAKFNRVNVGRFTITSAEEGEAKKRPKKRAKKIAP